MNNKSAYIRFVQNVSEWYMEIVKLPLETWDAGNLVVDNFTMTYNGVNSNTISDGVWGTTYSI